jgi:hypothetical protein
MAAEAGEVSGDLFLELGQGDGGNDGQRVGGGRVDEAQHLALGRLGGAGVGEDDVQAVQGPTLRADV